MRELLTSFACRNKLRCTIDYCWPIETLPEDLGG
jgi:hypothetical protein